MATRQRRRTIFKKDTGDISINIRPTNNNDNNTNQHKPHIYFHSDETNVRSLRTNINAKEIRLQHKSISQTATPIIKPQFTIKKNDKFIDIQKMRDEIYNRTSNQRPRFKNSQTDNYYNAKKYAYINHLNISR